MAANREITAAPARLYFWYIYCHFYLYFELLIKDSALSEQRGAETTCRLMIWTFD